MRARGHNQLWTRRQPTMEEKTVGYNGEDMEKKGKGPERGREYEGEVLGYYYFFHLDG